MKLGDVMKNAPNSLIWAVVVVFLGILGSFVGLSIAGSDTEALWVFINRLANLAGALFGGAGLLVAGAAAKSSANAEKSSADAAEAVNGSLDKKVEAAVRRAIHTPPTR